MKIQNINKLNILFFAIVLSIFNLTISMEQDIKAFEHNSMDINMGECRTSALMKLMKAVRKGDKDKVRSIIYSDVDIIYARDNDGGTPLMLAVANEHLDIVELLIDLGASADAKDNRGNTALIWSEIREYANIVKLAAGNIGAEKNNHKYIVELLIKYGANVNTQNNTNNTALMYAAINGHSDVVKLLIDAGANVNEQNDDGGTALILAKKYNHFDIAELLKAAGAQEGVFELSMFENDERIRKSKREKYDTDDLQELAYAVRTGDIDKIKFAIDSGVDINETDSIFGHTVLMSAAMQGRADIAKLLIDAKADVNIQDDSGKTALMWAKVNGHNNVALLLIFAGADLTARDKYGYSALYNSRQRWS